MKDSDLRSLFRDLAASDRQDGQPPAITIRPTPACVPLPRLAKGVKNADFTTDERNHICGCEFCNRAHEKLAGVRLNRCEAEEPDYEAPANANSAAPASRPSTPSESRRSVSEPRPDREGRRTSAAVAVAEREPTTSLTLLNRLRQRDQPDAWDRFVRLYTPLLRAWAKRRGLQEADADDLTHEVLLKLMRVLPEYTRTAGGSFRGWLFRVAANVGSEFRRRRATRALPGAGGLSSLEAEPPPDEFEEAEYRKALVSRGLELIRSDFAEPTWRAFVMIMIEARSATEVAKTLGVTPNAVYLARNRVLTRLRQALGDFLE
jgi:RNA polymerase sigma-70 factor, ECF subfamily